MIKFPYEPKQSYKFVSLKNKFMQEAMKAAIELSWNPGFNRFNPIGAVFVKDGKIIHRSGSGSDYHTKNGCERVKKGLVGGDYELCPGCSYKVHCEAKAVASANKKGIDLSGSDMYMFGHFWCCEPCCKALESVGVNNYYLLENAWEYFDRHRPDCKSGNWEFFYSLI